VDHAERDRQLIARLASGDRAALEPLYDQYSSAVFALLLRVVRNRQIAEELLQEVFLRAWQHAATFDSARGRLVSWLLGIAHHLALNELRYQRRRPQEMASTEEDAAEAALASVPDPDPDPADVAWMTMRRGQLATALALLPVAERAVLDLYATGYSQSEIAARLGEPLGTVKTRMRRGLHKLRAVLEHDL
jgi:RNA polymerase sigma-70 factor (ECF subfamily)